MKSLGLLLLLVPLAAALAWVALVDPSRDAPVAVAAARTAGDLVEARESGLAAESADPRARAESRVELPGTVTHGEREPRVRSSGRTLRVVSGESGRPLPGAVVTYWAAPEQEGDPALSARALLAEVLYADDPEVAMREGGERFVADDAGRLLLPPEPGLVMGRAGGLWQLEARVDPPLGEEALVLEPETTLVVRVVDSTGTPVGGVETHLVRRPEMEPWFGGGGESEPESGEVRFPHLGRRLLEARRGLYGREGQLGAYEVACVVHQLEPARLTLDAEDFPASPVDLVLADTGSVELRLVGEDLALALEDVVHMDLLQADVDEYDSLLPWVNWSIPFQRADAQGVTRYPRVGLGLEFLAVHGFAGGNGGGSKRFTGPVSPGEHVVVELPVEFDYPILSFRVLGEGTGPLAGVSLGIGITPIGLEADEGWSSSVETDERGRVRFHLARGYDAAIERGFELSVWAEGRDDFLAAKVELEVEATGVLEVGDLELPVASVLAAGYVTLESGEPVVGAKVHVGAPSLEVGVLGFSRRYGRVARTDSGGRFRVFGRPERGPCVAIVSHASYGTLEVPRFVVGDTSLHAVFAPPGALEGRVLASGDLESTEVSIELIVRGGAAARGVRMPSRTARVLSDGSFRFDRLPPGTYSLRPVVRACDEPLGEVSGLVVRSGETTTDERLQPLELPKLKLFEFTFLGSRGELPNWVDVCYRVTGTDVPIEDAAVQYVDGGYCRIRTAGEALDLLVESDLYRALELSEVRRSREIRLEAMPWIEVVPGPAWPDAPEGWTWELSLLETDDLSWWDTWDPAVPPRGRLRTRVSRPGPCEVLLELTHEELGSVSLAESLTIDVLSVAALQRFEFDADARDLDALVEIARQKSVAASAPPESERE